MTKKITTAKINDRFRGVFPFEFAEDKTVQAIPDMVHLIPIGQWDHDMYGPIMITSNDIREFANNFNANIRKGVYITAGHEGWDELPAQGWIKEVEIKDTGLYGKVEWTSLGKETLSDKQYKFISPEFYRDYEDPQTHTIHRNVLIGAALTKSPYFKELEAVVFSEPKFKNKFNQSNNMNLAELLSKDIATLTDEEKAFIKANAESLTEEQKTTYAEVIAETPAVEETPAEEPKADEETPAEVVEETPTEDPAPAEETVVPEETKADEPIEASDKKVMISASELAALKNKANEGAQAFAELKKQKLDMAVSKLVFSESNKAGKFLPKTTDNLRKFMETLNAAQMQSFSSLLNELPKTQIFDENGVEESGTESKTAQEELNAKVEKKMSENKTLKYSDAVKQVFEEDSKLMERYNDSLPSARKGQE